MTPCESPARGLRRTGLGGGTPYRAKEGRASAEKSLGVEVHREGNDQRRSRKSLHRKSDVRNGCASGWHGVCIDRTSSGLRWENKDSRRSGRAQGCRRAKDRQGRSV